MKNIRFNRIFIFIIFLGLILPKSFAQIIYSSPGNYTWIVPPCVTEITVEVWGGGGGGGSVWSRFNSVSGNGINCETGDEICATAGGGGGGGFASRTYTVVPGQVYNITVGLGGVASVNSSGENRANNGTNGGNSTFSGPATVGPGTLTGFGGSGGGAANISRDCSFGCNFNHNGENGAGGAGGSGSNGTAMFNGGNGKTGAHSASTNDKSGGGGGGAGNSANGTNGGLIAAGTGGDSGGGNGGSGINQDYGNGFLGTNGNQAVAIGGGGGGAASHNRNSCNSSGNNHQSRVGGEGARGEIRITYNSGAQPTPLFNPIAPICAGENLSPLPIVSLNGISGSWSPALNNTATTTYTFTSDPSNCANTATLTITVNQATTTPNFDQVAAVCSGSTLQPLPTNSTNGVSGSWSPALNNLLTSTYTFTPNAGECALTTTMTITINSGIVPSFDPLGPYCIGASIPSLPTSSTNGISGTWSPAINNSATTTYTFTPTLNTGECASTQTMSIIISAIITSTTSEVLCESELPFLWNGIYYNGAGIYSYYTQTAGGCDSTAILNLSISPNPLTSFIPSTNLFTESPQLVFFTNTSVGAATYSWDFGDGAFSSEDNPEYLFSNNSNGQTITLEAVSSEGCIGTYQITIEFEEGLIFYIPNTFTPDGDGYNQTFRPIFTSGFDPIDYHLIIFDRWGEIIFESFDISKGWDGTYGNIDMGFICPDCIYTWGIKYKLLNNDASAEVVGHISLLR